MAKAKKLPSGNWRVLVFSHRDTNGKRIYESFTAPTKQEAEMLAAKFANDNERKRSQDLTVKEAVQNYINSNAGVLSPATIYGYTKDMNRMECIHNLRIRKLTSDNIQFLIQNLIEKGLSPKTIKNTYGTLRSSLTFSGIEKNFMIHLPSAPKKSKIAPENDQVVALYNNASDKMKIAIALAAYQGLRRGEIASIKYKDIKGNTINIHSDIVWGIDNKWHYKDVPKSDASNRTIYLSETLLKLIGTGKPDDYILGINPNTIGENYRRLKKRLGIDIRFHDLRHYFASLAVVLGIPDIYTANLGGWRNGSKVLKEVYQNNISSINEGYAKKINASFEELCNTKCNTAK